VKPHSASPPRGSAVRVSRFFWLLVLALLIGAFLRLWQIGALPPGLHYDEAADTIIAQQIARGENAPIFVAAYTGKEVLFFYWAALWMKLIGPSVFAMRLAAALLGVLTVAVTYWTTRELFASRLAQPDRKTQIAGGQLLALLAAIFIATSFWHVLMSRLGFRSIGEPFIQALALAALFRGLRLERWGWIAVGGALVGLNLYTYLAARLFPVAIAAIFLFLIAFDRGRRRLRLAQFLVVALAVLAVFAPLGAYFLEHPTAFLTRIQQVAPRGDQAAALVENTGRALGMFFLGGDPYIRFNLPGRPLFSLAWGLLFAAGLILAISGVFRGRTLWRRTAYFSLIAVTFIMLLPTALAVNEITPSNLRAIGLMPLVFVFPALGLWWSAKYLWTRMNAEKLGLPGRQRRYVGLVMAGALLFSAVETTWTYFRVYVNEPELYVQSDGDLADMARWLNSHDTRGEPVYLAALHYRHPTVAAVAEKYGDIKWIAGDRAVVLPNGPGYLFFARLGLPDEAWLRRVLPEAALIEEPLAPDGETNYRLYHLAAQPVVTPQVQLNVNFGNLVELIGYDIEPAQPSTPLRSAPEAGVTLYWRVLNKPDRGDYSTFAQLRDAWGFEWGKGGSFDYPAEQWTPGEVIVNRLDVPVGAGAPPGDYELRVGWFSQAANQRLNVVAPDGGFGGTVARLSPLPIDQVTTETARLNIGTRLDREVAPGLKLLGYTQETSEAQPGAPIDVTLYWQTAGASKDELLTLQLTSCGCGNQPRTTTVLTTTPPVHGAYPLSRWQPGEIVADRYRLRVPVDAASGDYTLEVSSGNGAPVELGPVSVQQGKRVLSEPPLDHRLETKLDDAIELVGYNLDRTDAAIRLTLIWRALKTLDEDYTVFTHVLDRSGQSIAGKDNQPANGTYPTSHWLPGEYVMDEYVIPGRPPDDFGIEVGLYDPETGARLGQTIRLK
jgi:4-amino-4-deoxy-L-arabinose transferase-like glycosyltransferase